MPGEIQINAQTQTPYDLFSAPRCFTTPEFQRPYVWSAAQIDQFWDDIAKLAASQETKHFTGVILLQDDAPGGHIRCPKVIDGQQRLTTLQLLLSALRVAYQNQGNQAAADDIYDLYLTNRRGVPPDQAELAYKISHSHKQDAKAFRDYVHHSAADFAVTPDEAQPSLLTDTAPAPPDDSPAIAAAYRRLHDKVKEYGQRQDLDALQQAILSRVTLAVIQANADEPTVYDMFSRLNAAGSLLAVPDLVKAETFRQIAALPNPDDQAKAADLWTYSEAYWQEHHGIGANSRSNLGHLLHHWLCADAGEFISDNRGNETTMTAYRNATARHGIIKGLDILKGYGDAYRKIQARQLDEYPRFVRDFHTAGYDTAYTLALFCLTELHQDARAQALNEFGAYLMRLALTGVSSNSLNKAVAQIAGRSTAELRQLGGQIPPARQANIVRDEILAITGTLRWPDDHSVIAQLSNRPIAPGRAKAVITAIAEQRQGPNSDVSVRPDATLEHIMPRSWQRNWPLPDHANAPQERKDAIRMLGNLTLLHGVPNAQASNGAWAQKRYTLAQSDLAINRPLAELEQWDEAAISKRSAELAAVACQIWPKPGAGMTLL